MYVHICPVIILIQLHLKYIYTCSVCLNMAIVEIHTQLPEYKPTRPVALSLHTRRGNINIVLEMRTYTPSGYLNTAEIEKDIHTPNGHINMVPINLTYMLSDNLNTCAINKYTNMLGDNNHIIQ